MAGWPPAATRRWCASANGPAQVLVTIYQITRRARGAAPNLQVMRLLEACGTARRPSRGPARGRPDRPAPLARGPAIMEMVAHIQERGDVGAMLGDWLGERGSKRWIEGFGLSPTHTIAPKEIEYQAVLGQGWLSPWVEGGQFCGSRAMALPLLGLRVRLRGAAAETHDVGYAATFIDGSAIGPVMNGEACEADSLAAMEAFQIVIRPRAERRPPARARPGQGRRPRFEPPAPPEPPARRRGNPRRKEPEPRASRAGERQGGDRVRPQAVRRPGRRVRVNYLFVHQNFPGQYYHIIQHLLRDPGNHLVFVSEPNKNRIEGVRRVFYQAPKGEQDTTHPNARDWEGAARRAEMVAQTAGNLKRLGFVPDVIIGHHGWGELLDLCDVWPGVPILGYYEFYYDTARPGCRLRPGVPGQPRAVRAHPGHEHRQPDGAVAGPARADADALAAYALSRLGAAADPPAAGGGAARPVQAGPAGGARVAGGERVPGRRRRRSSSRSSAATWSRIAVST